ncbi:MAG: TlpA family protein disulfide reductase [Ignavibacteria bacterium]|nr:TlpA family protein disulfide reductase [Ignavibacteria bacterium]
MTIMIGFLIALFILTSNTFSQTGAKVGDKAPAMTVEEWLKGESVNTFENGKVYLVEFWGTWCSPCIENIPHLSEIQKKYSSDGLIVIGVASHEFDGRAKLDDFMKRRGNEMEYRVAYDSDLTMQSDWDGVSDGSNFRLPICFLVNKSGNVVFVGNPSDKSLEDLIAKTIGE